MKRQTILGSMFLVLGIVLFLIAVVIPALSRQMPSTLLLGMGFIIAIFGAWLIPNSGVKGTVHDMQAEGISIPFLSRSGRRTGDNITVGEIEIPKPEKIDG